LAELGAFGPLYTFGYMPRAWTVTTVGAAVLWLCSYWSTRWTTLLPGLWAGVVGASAPVVVGQVLVGPHHDVGSDAGTIQLLAAALLLGPVLVAEGIRWLSRDPSRRGPLDVHLLLRTAVFGTWIVLAMELVLMWFMLAGTRPWDSMTGLLFLIRLALLAALLATLTTARRRSPHRTLEPALLIVLWLAVGSAMTRIPPAVLRAHQHPAGLHGVRGHRTSEPRDARGRVEAQPPLRRPGRHGDRHVPRHGARRAPSGRAMAGRSDARMVRRLA